MRLAVWPVAPARALARALATASGADGRPLVSAVSEAEPHTLRAALDAGEVDLALLPTLDVFRAPDHLALVPDVGLVGEAGPRRALVATAALDAIAAVGFDPRDTLEALVAQMVLRENYGLAPVFALADLAEPLPRLLDAHGAVLAPSDAPTPEGAYRLDLGREWTDLTLRPMPWGLVAAKRDALDAPAAAALAAAVAAMPPDDALWDDGVAAYQLTLDGYAHDGLGELAEHLFATGTLSDLPDLPFVALPPSADAPASAPPDDLPAGDGAPA